MENRWINQRPLLLHMHSTNLDVHSVVCSNAFQIRTLQKSEATDYPVSETFEPEAVFGRF